MNLDFKNDRHEFNRLLDKGDLNAAHDLAKEMHIRYHDLPFEHVKVHEMLMKVTGRKKEFHKVAGHSVAGYVFAVPISLLQKSTGVVLPAFNRDKH